MYTTTDPVEIEMLKHLRFQCTWRGATRNEKQQESSVKPNRHFASDKTLNVNASWIKLKWLCLSKLYKREEWCCNLWQKRMIDVVSCVKLAYIWPFIIKQNWMYLASILSFNKIFIESGTFYQNIDKNWLKSKLQIKARS